MFLRTERLFLRPAWLEDAPELTRAIGQEPVVRMLARVPWPYREEHARAWIGMAKDPKLPRTVQAAFRIDTSAGPSASARSSAYSGASSAVPRPRLWNVPARPVGLKPALRSTRPEAGLSAAWRPPICRWPSDRASDSRPPSASVA